MREEGRTSVGSVRTAITVGLFLGLAITVGLAIAVLHDRTARLDAARRQSMTLATGTDRLLMYELRNLERAMTGIAADGDAFFRTAAAQAPALLSEAIAGVVLRHPELESIVLYDPAGRALSVGDADPALPQWTAAAPTASRPLLLGPLHKGLGGGWVVPVALRTREGGWLVTRLRTSEFGRMIARLDLGREGSMTIVDRRGTMLARNGGGGDYIGRRVALPDLDLMRAGVLSLDMASEFDGISRAATFSSSSGYPVIVVAGIGLREALAPWRLFAGTAAALVVLYWLGLLFLVRRMRAAETAREAMLAELQANADWLRQAQLASRTGVWRLESDQSRVRASEQAAALFGFPPTAETIPLEHFFERMHDEDRARVKAEFAASRQHGAPFRSEYRIVLPDGQIRWIKARGALAVDGRGEQSMTGTIVDITERREATARIERAEAQFRELFERNPLPFWVFDVETLRFLAVNETAIRNYGYTREEFLAMTILQIRPEEDAAAVRESLFAHPGRGYDDRVWVHLTRDGRRIEVRVHSSGIEFAGRAARLVLAEDVSERAAYERDLSWRATHDTTTGMLTVEALVHQVDGLPCAETGYAIAYVQLRDLELVAPTLGRRAGEAILRAAADRFGEVGQKYGLIAYLPAESFVVVAVDPAQRDDMLASLVRATATPVRGESGTHPLEAWIGLADGPGDCGSAEQVIGNAALAALQARRDGMPIVRFDATMAAKASGRLALAGRLRQALERQEFELFFQPIRRLRDGHAMSLEALLRWRQPDGSFVPTAQFIPLCEESGLIVPLGEWVLEEAARCHGRLVAQDHAGMAIAVNVSAVQFLSETLPQSLRKLREAHGLPRGALQLELTESVVLRRPDAAREAMGELRNEGVCISIDDFGTGFSSMAYLKDLPLDFLKIDRAFVADVHLDKRNAAICSALIALGHGLGLKIIAEGVESDAQRQWLLAQGCDQAQGFLFGRPAPLEEVMASMRQNGGAN
ncbi:EAL domain-containing protein [Luteimonas sp. SX5]|uniref:EAL domain-containing protein n=1 Tax=Luteimonas galliterrae TaxID=2940486 RepID=A0ABT0MH03_9GAMM|nr:EAL domain-containing protein [Luteimonas galliterrae]MCL1634152.1 EAL domain-containing protein [Luteimonas galliterrae]